MRNGRHGYTIDGDRVLEPSSVDHTNSDAEYDYRGDANHQSRHHGPERVTVVFLVAVCLVVVVVGDVSGPGCEGDRYFIREWGWGGHLGSSQLGRGSGQNSASLAPQVLICRCFSNIWLCCLPVCSCRLTFG